MSLVNEKGKICLAFAILWCVRCKCKTFKKIALIGVFIALCVAINSFEINLSPELKFSFTITVCTLAGLFTGFIGGALTGFLGDILGCLFTGLTPIPLLSLSNTLLGLIPGLAFDLYRLFAKKPSIVIGVIIVATCQLILFGLVTLLINPYAIWSFYGLGAKVKKTYTAWVIARVFPIQLINSSMNLVLSCLLCISIFKIPFFKDYLNFDKSKDEVEQQVENGNG